MFKKSTILIFTLALALFYCSDDFSSDLDPEELTDEEKAWLNDEDGDGVPDSIAIYAADCDLPVMECLEIAREIKDSSMQVLNNTIPLVSVPGGTYNDIFTVELTTGTNVVIRYTTDGSDPTQFSSGYDKPIEVTSSMVIKARIVFNDTILGPITLVTYELKAAVPEATPGEGFYQDTQSVLLTSPTEGVIIRYSLDGSEPTDTSATYSDAINIEATTTLKARAFRDGWTPSDVLEVNYAVNIAGTVIGPVFTPEGATYNKAQLVSITSGTEGAGIYYTTDGSSPDTSSTLYGVPFDVTGNTVIKAVAYLPGLDPSAVASATYTLRPNAPVFSPAEGSYNSVQLVTLSVSSPDDAEIHYTTDGSIPDHDSPTYTGAITLDKSTTLSARAFKDGWDASNESKAAYSITLPGQVSAPVFLPSGGTHINSAVVNISTTTQDAKIYITKNGDEPTTSDSLFESDILVGRSMTVKAIAVKSGLANSPTSLATFTIRAAPPVFNPNGGIFGGPTLVRLNTSTEGGVIHYTFNGNDPDNNSPIVVDSLQITESGTLKARTFKVGMQPSVVSSAEFTVSNDPPVADPVFFPPGGTYTGARQVTITSETEDADIHYTTGQADPTRSSTLYERPIDVTSSVTIKAIAYKNGLVTSQVKSAAYNITVGKSLTLTAPNGGEVLVVGSFFNITWTSTGNIGNVKLEYSDGSTWRDVVTSTENDGSFAWVLPNNITDQALVSIKEVGGQATDNSDAVFSIIAATDNNANLSALTLSHGTLSPAFSSSTLSYTASVGNTVSSITVTPTASSPAASIKVAGVEVESGGTSGPIILLVGENEFDIEVMAEDGSTKKTYTVTVTRAASSNADLSALIISRGILNPSFTPDTLGYSASVPNTISGLRVTPSSSHAGATITVNGNPVASGTPSDSIGLNVGTNIITVIVTAEDDNTQKTYIVNMTRGTNTAPVFEPVENYVAYENQPLVFSVYATDADTNTLTYTAPVKPQGSTFTGNQFSWTPTSGQAGNHPVTFVVTDNGTPNLTDTATITITVIAVVNPGLIAHWDFNSTSGSILTDVSGNGHHGQINGTPNWQSGVDGNALLLNGVDNNIVVPTHPVQSGLSALTVEMWVNVHAMTAGSFAGIFHKWGPLSIGDDFISLAIFHETGLDRFSCAIVANPAFETSDSHVIRLNHWTHFAFVYTGDSTIHYTNGAVTYAAEAIEGPLQSNTIDLVMGSGGWAGNYANYLKGYMDEVKFYSRALSYSEIQTEYTKNNENLPATFTDSRDGQVYNKVTIGLQTWMAQNLNYISQGGTGDASWCYGNLAENCDTYGRLYSWNDAMGKGHGNGSDICPVGWHLPSDDEWQTLELFLGIPLLQLEAEGYRGVDQGEKLKSVIWNGTDEYGFNAFPAGIRNGNFFINIGVSTSFWTSNQNEDIYAWYRGLTTDQGGIARSWVGKSSGFSVRCLED